MELDATGTRAQFYFKENDETNETKIDTIKFKNPR